MITLQNAEVVRADALDYLGDTVDDSILVDEIESEDVYENRLRSSYLYSGTVKITNNGNGYVGIYGSTDCYVDCDKVKTYIYLERSTGNGAFSSYRSWEYSSTNTCTLSKSFTYPVEKGYYYRLRGYHSCTKNGTTENAGTRTNGIYIG
ncbi:MAG: DUF6147 family protein [Fusicatenibacter sp.]